MAKLASTVSNAAATSEKLGSVSVSTANSLVGMGGGAEGVAASLLGMVGAGDLSVGMLTALAAGAGLVFGALALLGTAIVKGTTYYIEHADAAKGIRDEIGNLADAWDHAKMVIGEAVVGGSEASIAGSFRLLGRMIDVLADKTAGLIHVMKDYVNMSTGYIIPGVLNALDPGARPRDTHGDVYLPNQGDIDLTSHNYLDFELPQTVSDDASRAYYLAQKKLAEKRAREQAAIAGAMQLNYHIGLGSMPGERVDLLQAGLSDIRIPNIPYHLGLGSAPGLQYDVSKPTIDSTFLSRLLGRGGLGGDLGATLMHLLVQRGDPGSALGGTIGGDIMGSLMGGGSGKAINGALSGVFGGKVGGAIGKFLPFGGEILGSLVGKLFGHLFGETQGHKDVTEGNKQIDDMKGQLLGVYGTMQNLQNVGKMFGIDWQATWGDQNLAGAKHFQSVLDDLAKKQAKFNGDLGGTLGKIKDLGGNIPEAMIPYLDQLKDAKVLTQENIDLIATMSGQNTVDFGKMEEAANRYGISIDALGQNFKDHKMHEGWQQIIDDLDLLQRGGADMDAVLGSEGMQKKISELVQQSMHFGTTIPNNMKPFIQKLIDSGKLIGDDGKAITDISKLTFGGDMQTSLDTLNKTLQDLIDALKIHLPAAAADGARRTGQAWRDNLGEIPLPGGIGGGGKSGGGGGGGGAGASTASIAQPINLNMNGRTLTTAIAQVVIRQ
jgi:hypothetical protein